MVEPFAMANEARIDIRHDTEAPIGLIRRVIEAERDQKADEARIEEAIRQAEAGMAAALRYRVLSPEQWRAEIVARRDRAILTIRDVRKNMLKRIIEAKKMQRCFSSGQRSRFSDDDVVDATLRTRLVELLQRAPTFSLVDHFRESIEARNIACAEIISFEFRCRYDRHKYTSDFDEIGRRSESYYTVEMMRRRVSNILNAVAKVDLRITDLLNQATQYVEQISVVDGVVVVGNPYMGRDALAPV
jgi:hypothetical protein